MPLSTRLVLDANVVVSAALSDTAVRKIVRHVMAHDTLVFSPPIIAEYFAVLTRPKFERYLSRPERLKILAELLHAPGAILIKPSDRISACRDPKDDKYLEAACTGDAAFILSGDSDLLALDPWHSTRIIRPTAYKPQILA